MRAVAALEMRVPAFALRYNTLYERASIHSDHRGRRRHQRGGGGAFAPQRVRLHAGLLGQRGAAAAFRLRAVRPRDHRSHAAGHGGRGRGAPRARLRRHARHRDVGAHDRRRQGGAAEAGRRRLPDQALRPRRAAGSRAGAAAPRRRSPRIRVRRAFRRAPPRTRRRNRDALQRLDARRRRPHAFGAGRTRAPHAP